MKPINFVLIQMVFAILFFIILRFKIGILTMSMIRSLLFTAILFFLIDHLGDTRDMWFLNYDGLLNVLGIPLENIIFTFSMTIHLIFLYESLKVLLSEHST